MTKHATPLTVRITSRPATSADIPFLARIEEIASTPPFEVSGWAQFVDPTGTPVRDFSEAMFAADASRWGSVRDFIVLEVEGAPAAACCVYDADPAPGDKRPLRLDRIAAVAAALGWSDAVADAFIDLYEETWGPEDPPYLQPQAAAIVECVGVLPEFRGMGLGDRLMEAAFAEARARGHGDIGIMATWGNDRAMRLYDRHFARHVTFHADAFGGRFPGLVRFRADLRAAA